MKIHQDNADYMTKMAAMSIYGKTLQKSSFTGPILMKLCKKHQIPKPIIICANYHLWLTLTYFTAMSNFATGFYMGKM